MKKEDATAIIESIIDSLRTEPDQFHFEVKVTTVGAMGIGGAGGPGIMGVSHGGGIGVSASASAPTQMQIEIARKNADAEIRAQGERILALLSELVQELRNTSPDKQRATGLMETLKTTWLPSVLINVISQLIGASLGA